MSPWSQRLPLRSESGEGSAPVSRGCSHRAGSQPCVPSHRALLEEARQHRLLEDSDSEDEAAPIPPRLSVRPNPTAILDEATQGKRKVGSLGSRSQLARLIVVKKTRTEAEGSERGQAPEPETPTRGTASGSAPQVPGTSSLSQLGAYGDSGDSDSNN